MAEQFARILRAAVENGDLNLLEVLLRDGGIHMIENTNLFDGQTPLHIAVDKMQVEVVKLLIHYGVNINLKDRGGKTPIIYAIENGNADMTELLLLNGADVKEDPKTLYTSEEDGNMKIIKDLLKDGAGVDMIKYAHLFFGLTPLHIAVNNTHMEVVKLLLDYDVDLNIKDFRGRTPIVSAIESGNTELTELLLINGTDISEDPMVLRAAVETGNLHIVEDVLNDGDGISMLERTHLFLGLSLLHMAANRMQLEVAKLLINYGVNVNLKDCTARTPLVYAIENSHIEMMELLLINGAYIIMDPDLLIGNSKIIKRFKHQAAEARAAGNFNDVRYLQQLIHNTFVYSPTCMLLKLHIAKLKAAGFFVPEPHFLWLSKYNDIDNLLYQCEAEVEIMKIEKIGNSCASFYDILRKNASAFAKNESIVRGLKSDEYKTKFPIYASMIDSRVRRVLERVELLKEASKSCVSLFEFLPEFPLRCAETIFNYLGEVDLRILLASCL